MERVTLSAGGVRREKIHALTGLRFIAAAMIVLHHSRGVLALPQDFLAHFSLQQGVSFFFVLSGFILTHVYPSLRGGAALRHFFVARVARIWPAHAFTFALTIALGLHTASGGAAADPSPVVAAGNLAMVHAWVPTTGWFFSFNAVSWSISTEFFFYLAFPLLIGCFPKHFWRAALIGLGLLVGTISFCAWLQPAPFASALPYEVNRAGLLYVSPAARLAEFVLGMLTALLWRRSAGLDRISWKTATLLEGLAVALAIGAVAFFSARVTMVKIVGNYWSSYLYHAGAAPAFALLILLFAGQRGCFSKWCATRPMVLLGEISFSIYLLHQLLLRWSTGHRHLWAGSSEGVIYGLFWVALLGASWVLWRWVERPARRWILRFAPAV